MRNILLITANTLRVTFRVRSRIIVYFVVPALCVMIVFFINSIGGGLSAAVGVVDNDGSKLARELVKGLNKTGSFRTSVAEPQALDRLLTAGQLDCGLVIPAGYGDDILAGSLPAIRIVSIKGESVTAWLEQFVDLFSGTASALAAAAGGDRRRFDALYAEAADKGARLTVETLSDVSAGRKTTVSSVGYLVFFLILGAGLTMQLVLEERRNRTYARIKSAPVRASQYIAGNGLAGFMIVLAQILAVLSILRLILQIETFVPDLLFFAILFVFGFAAVAFAMTITAFSRSSFVASILLNLSLIPSCMIAGCFWPIEFMPPFLQKLALFFPQRWVLDAIQKAQSGAGMGEIAVNLLIIAGFALALFLAASLRFSRMEESGQFV
jgi:ABC-2 type transport system permease protein